MQPGKPTYPASMLQCDDSDVPVPGTLNLTRMLCSAEDKNNPRGINCDKDLQLNLHVHAITFFYSKLNVRFQSVGGSEKKW